MLSFPSSQKKKKFKYICDISLREYKVCIAKINIWLVFHPLVLPISVRVGNNRYLILTTNHTLLEIQILTIFFFFFFGGTGVWTWASCLLGRGSTVQAMSFFALVILEIGYGFLPRPAWTPILLYASRHCWDDRCVPPHPAIGWDRGLVNYLLRLTSNFDPPHLTLPSCDYRHAPQQPAALVIFEVGSHFMSGLWSYFCFPMWLGWQAHATEHSHWLSWGLMNFLPMLVTNHDPPNLCLLSS
jgi:hypothetical protein